jgi:hypothetical protein
MLRSLFTEKLSALIFRVIDVDHQRSLFEHWQSTLHDCGVLPVGDHDLGFAMLQHETDGFRIEAQIQRIQHRTDHRHRKVCLVHGGHIRCHQRHGISNPNTTLLER